MSKVYSIEVCDAELEIIQEALALLLSKKNAAAGAVEVTAWRLDRDKEAVKDI